MSTLTELTVAERVKAGVEFLDTNRPGWDALIDLETLRLALPCFCVLGQIYGSYWKTPFGKHGRANQVDAARMGFNVYPPLDDDDHYDQYDLATFAEYAALDSEWRRVITERREPAVASPIGGQP